MPEPSGEEPGDTAVIVPAKNEEARIAATIAAAQKIPGVDLVVVVDDGSTDDTTRVATAAGATVLRHQRNRGKAAAMESGAAAVRAADANEQRAPRFLLFLDADLEGTASSAGALVPPVRSGAADMTIAVLPPQSRKGGGHGFVVKLSRRGILAATGFTATQPLSGQRCLNRLAFEAARPLAFGFGVETALTIDLLQAGLVVREVECELHHRVTGADWRGQVHRLRQYAHVLLALGVRRVRTSTSRQPRASGD